VRNVARSRAVRAALRWAFLLLLLAAAAVAVRSQWHRVRPELRRLSVADIAAAEAALLMALACSVFAWRTLLADLGSPLPAGTAMRIFFVGQMGKYLPGSVWPVVTQMEMGRAAGVPRARVAAASLLTIGVSLLAGLLVGLLALPALLAGGATSYGALVLLLPLGLFLAQPRVLNWGLRRAARLLRRPEPQQVISASGLRRAFAWCVLVWFANGVQAWVLARALGATGAGVLPLAIGGFALAFTAGTLFLIAPAGAGVREAVLLVVFAGTLPVAAATALAIVSRLLSTVADIVVAAIALIAGGRTTTHKVPGREET